MSRLQEVQILTNQFDAEWGRASGAVINAVTKSGTNSFTGSAFNFYTSKGMTNKDFFTKAQGLDKPDVGKKEWGGTLGGPIVRNKLHFFFSLERISQSRNFTKSFLARPEYSTSVGSEESAWNYVVAHRSSDQRQAHVGVPLAAGTCAAVQSPRRRAGNARKLRRRDRLRPHHGRHADLGAVGHQGQHRARRLRVRRHGPCESGVARARPRIRPLRAMPGRRRHPHHRGRLRAWITTRSTFRPPRPWTTRRFSAAIRWTTPSRGSSLKSGAATT